MSTTELYIPEFLEAELSSGDDPIAIRDRLQKKNWLTVGLVEEITGLFPVSGDIDPVTGGRDPTRFAESCSKLCPRDRGFASEQQIEQASPMSLHARSSVQAHT